MTFSEKPSLGGLLSSEASSLNFSSSEDSYISEENKELLCQDRQKNEQELIAQLIAENQQLKQEVREKNQELEECKINQQGKQEGQKVIDKSRISIKNSNSKEQDLLNLCELIEVLQKCVSLNQAQSLIIMEIPYLFPLLSGKLYSFNEDKNRMEAMTSWGNYNDSKFSFFTDDCWGLKTGRFHKFENHSSSLCSHHIHHGDKSKYSLCLPIISREEIFGLLYLCHRKESLLSEDKMQFAMMVAKHLALILSNLKFQEKLRQDCIRDPLTGLFNRRYLEESLKRELLRSQRTEKPLGVIMVDVDHFKKFNDNYSHEAGDKVLQVVGEFLQESIRGSDIACRYGGEELTLILPDANLKQTQERAEEIRQGMKQLIIRYKGEKLPQVTASFGVASYPQQGTTSQMLLSKADAALYAAKDKGRDCVMTAA
jgi:diguanylate cyclase (GGDEF)-like protein